MSRRGDVEARRSSVGARQHRGKVANSRAAGHVDHSQQDHDDSEILKREEKIQPERGSGSTIMARTP